MEDEPQLLAAERGERMVVEVFDRTAIDVDAPLGGPVEEADQVQQRALPRTRRADERDELSFADGKIDAVENLGRDAIPVRFTNAVVVTPSPYDLRTPSNFRRSGSAFIRRLEWLRRGPNWPPCARVGTQRGRPLQRKRPAPSEEAAA